MYDFWSIQYAVSWNLYDDVCLKYDDKITSLHLWKEFWSPAGIKDHMIRWEKVYFDDGTSLLLIRFIGNSKKAFQFMQGTDSWKIAILIIIVFIICFTTFFGVCLLWMFHAYIFSNKRKGIFQTCQNTMMLEPKSRIHRLCQIKYLYVTLRRVSNNTSHSTTCIILPFCLISSVTATTSSTFRSVSCRAAMFAILHWFLLLRILLGESWTNWTIVSLMCHPLTFCATWTFFEQEIELVARNNCNAMFRFGRHLEVMTWVDVLFWTKSCPTQPCGWSETNTRSD